jgi:hypothetical protein
MSALADLLLYTAIALFCAGVLLNIEYVLTLPGRVPRDARGAVVSLAGDVVLTGKSRVPVSSQAVPRTCISTCSFSGSR